MATRDKLVFETPSDADSIETGRVEGRYERSATPRADAKASVYTNLTEHGAKRHHIDGDTTLEVVVCEHGIWITPADE